MVTASERRRKQSLPESTRDRPAEEVERRQSLPGGQSIPGRGGGAEPRGRGGGGGRVDPNIGVIAQQRREAEERARQNQLRKQRGLDIIRKAVEAKQIRQRLINQKLRVKKLASTSQQFQTSRITKSKSVVKKPTGIPRGVITAPPKTPELRETFLGVRRIRFDIDRSQKKLQTKNLRGKLSSKEVAQLFILTGIKSGVIDPIIGFADLGRLGLTIVKDPKLLLKTPEVIRQIPSGIKKSSAEFGEVIRTSPTEATAIIGGNVFALAGSSKVINVVSKGSQKGFITLSGKNRKIITSATGEKTIKNIKGVGDIEIIPEGGLKLDVDPLRAVKEANIQKILRETPKIPKTSSAEKRLLKVVKRNNDIVTGSFAQEALVKKQFSRKHKDIDVLTKDRPKLIKDLKKEFGKDIKFRKLKNSIELIFKNKVIADLVKLEIGEQGFAKKFRSVQHQGLNIAPIEARLSSKVAQLGLGKRGKVVRDIETLTRKRLRTTTKKGAFGFKKKQQEKIIGKAGPLVTAQVDLLGKGILKPSELKLKRWLFASPFNPKTGAGQLRTSRLGIGKDEEASLLDLLASDISFKRNKPQIFVFPKEKIFKSKQKLVKSKLKKTDKGFVIPNFSSELEVVLGDGFLIKRVKRLDSVPIKGQLVPIIELKKIKIPNNVKQSFNEIKSLQSNLRKAKGKNKKDLIKKIDSAESKLNKKIKKVTGFDYYSSASLKKRKVVNLKKTTSKGVLSSVSRFNKKITGRKSPPSRTKPRRTPSPPKRTTPRPSPPVSPLRSTRQRPSPIKQPPRLPPKFPPRFPPKTTPKIPPTIRRKLKIKQRRKKKVVRSYDVFGRPLKKKGAKRKPKLIKINKRRLSELDAKNLRNFVLDTSLARTGSIKRRRVGKPQKPLLRVPSGFAKRTTQKFRRFKIKKGKRIPLPKGKVIERGRNLLDTRSEREKITLKRRLASLTKSSKIKVRKAKRTPAQRKQMLKNLSKARQVKRGKKK